MIEPKIIVVVCRLSIVLHLGLFSDISFYIEPVNLDVSLPVLLFPFFLTIPFVTDKHLFDI